MKQTAINILSALGHYGYFEELSGYIEPLLEYKSLELISKTEAIIKEEFQRMSFFNTQYFADVSRDLKLLFRDADEKGKRLFLGLKDLEEKIEEKEEEKQEPVDAKKPKEVDTANFLKMMNKQAGKAKKGKKSSKKPEEKPKTQPKLE